MSENSVRKYWLLWSISTVIIILVLGYLFLIKGTDKTMFMPGPLSAGHHQLVDSCESCHTSKFGGGEVLQASCIDCHGDERVKPHDSHPRTKFKDPRNADTLKKINALECVSCHVEHRPEITLKDGLTEPKDVCFHCHAQVAEERPSHEGMPFNSCKDSGCHNFHNNRALYTDFLVKHMDDPAINKTAHVPAKEFADTLDEIIDYPRDRYPVTQLSIEDIDAPLEKRRDQEIVSDWFKTAHAQAGVNCSACHQVPNKEDDLSEWNDSPEITSCNRCHNNEVDRFKKGKHGMRLQANLTPMTPSLARLPMHKDAAHEELTCNSCHGAHSYDVAFAAVDGCLQCHTDEHSIAYKQSKHFTLWQNEQNNISKANSGVSCASCHMPRIDYDVSEWSSRIMVDHNQSNNLSPNSKMIRSSCQHCHGLGFTLDSLADQNLINNNFNGLSSIHVESIDLARKDLERYLQERNQALQ